MEDTIAALPGIEQEVTLRKCVRTLPASLTELSHHGHP